MSRFAEFLVRACAFLVAASFFSGPAQAAGFTNVPSLATARYLHTATLLPSGKVLVAGGQGNGGVIIASAELYDPASNTWSAAGALATARENHTATLLPSGKVLVVGGQVDGGVALASAELYDPASDTWSAASSLAAARTHHTATLLPSGKVLVVGGSGSSGVLLASAELYDPASNTWSAAGALAVAREGQTATLLPSGEVFVAGGVVGSGGIQEASFESPEIYDPVSNTWSVAYPTLALHSQTSTLLPSGKVLVAGGSDFFGAFVSVHAQTELYDPASNTWSDAAILAEETENHTATLLPSGKVLVAGGDNGVRLLPSAELYDPVSNTWSAAGLLATARTQPTATLLLSGKVLVVAGYGGGGYLASTELYESTSNNTFNLDQHGLTGAWYNPAIGGQGLLVETYPDLFGSGHGYLAAGWYTFDLTAAGGQRWYTVQGDAISGSASVPLTIYTSTGGNFNAPPTISAVAVGTATLSFSDCTHGTLAFHFNDGRPDGSIALTRLDTNVTCTPTGDNTNATANYLLSGAWYDSTHTTSGQGFFFDFSPALTTLFGAWYTYSPNGASIGGGASQRWYTIQDNAFTPGTTTKNGLPIYETTGGTFNTAGGASAGSPVGTANIVISSCSSMTLSYTFSAGTNARQSGSVSLTRVVGAPVGCSL